MTPEAKLKLLHLEVARYEDRIAQDAATLEFCKEDGYAWLREKLIHRIGLMRSELQVYQARIFLEQQKML